MSIISFSHYRQLSPISVSDSTEYSVSIVVLDCYAFGQCYRLSSMVPGSSYLIMLESESSLHVKCMPSEHLQINVNQCV